MFNDRKCSLDIVGIYSEKHIQILPVKTSRMEFLLKIDLLKAVNYFLQNKSSEYASDSIINFILKYIPVIYITSLA